MSDGGPHIASMPGRQLQLSGALRRTGDDVSGPASDPTVWAVTCVLARAGFRRRGIGYALVEAAVDFARRRGARALEGYPMLTEPGQDITWGELNVGTRSMFEAAGLTEVSRPSLRRVVMRIDFGAP